ncbi:hypothetical protein J1N35_023565 [Gossypium stocksii]|uniref:Uncharacterized protein n=1 Tax=Gossypium stocksii TaxID=47602 RepID=A0A9D3VJR8_9ROSI|nr:hypothetical protein J1N35_023565 [Gossypium stocksii]
MKPGLCHENLTPPRKRPEEDKGTIKPVSLLQLSSIFFYESFLQYTSFFPRVSKKIHVICQANLIKGRLAHFLFSISKNCSNVGREECNKYSQRFSFGTLLTNFQMLRYIDELFKNRVNLYFPSWDFICYYHFHVKDTAYGFLSIHMLF